jgi:hypothetical protein
VGGDHIENVGKWALEQSGKYRVNKNDEGLTASFRSLAHVRVSHRHCERNETTERVSPS